MEMRIIMSQAKEINHELNIISRYMGLIISKYLIFALLIITLYPMNIIPGYILLAGIIFPAALRFAVNLETSPDKNTASPKKADVSDRECSFTLSQTAKKYNFSYKKYKAENYNFILISLLLVVWQNVLIQKIVFSYPVNIIASFMLIMCVISGLLAKILFHFKIHHDFINLNI